MESLIIIKSKKLDIAARKDSIDNYTNELYKLISSVNDLIKTYEQENDPQKITEIVNIYNDNIRETLVNIRTNKYFVNRVNVESKKEPGNITTYGTLIQKEIDDENMYIYFDDEEKSERKIYRN